MAGATPIPGSQFKINLHIWAKICSSARLSIPELVTVISIQNAILGSGQAD